MKDNSIIKTEKSNLQQAISKPKTLENNVSKDAHPFTVVAIGASAGGLEAITQLLQNLSPSTGMAFIFVQHLSPDHKSLLTPILSKITAMKVQEIDDMEAIEPNNLYIIPHDKEIEVVDGHIKLLPRAANRKTNLSIDILFSSLAETHKENVIGIVLSGNANDGSRGLKEIKNAGGITFAQDNSAKFVSMPHSAIDANVVDFVLSPAEIAQELMLLSESPFLKSNISKIAPEDQIANDDPDLKSIIELLLKTKNADFACYKMNTIKRRILRRMLILKIKHLSEYAVLLKTKKTELDILFQDFLINVTEFFRDSEAFLMLKETIFPALLKLKTHENTLRIWVAACATGEEVYSIAITIAEIQKENATNITVQIFASDLSASAIAIARGGEYTQNQLKNISAARLQQFFTKSKDSYRVSKQLRDMCVFAQHNILKDPPFSRMDFISCRNFLIYLDANAQKKAITTFNYSLNDSGILLLGKSETIGGSAQLFSVIDKKCKIYSRKKKSISHVVADSLSRLPLVKTEPSTGNIGIIKKTKIETNRNFGDAFDTILLEKYVPASVVINHELEILRFRGQTNLFLENTSGKASFNILKMASTELTFELRSAIHHAIKTTTSVKKSNIEINKNATGFTVRKVDIEVQPLIIDGNEPLLMVVFLGKPENLIAISNNESPDKADAKDIRIKKLEQEIAAARSDMNTIVSDQETANEELQSANEEVISSNEELQSLNEELETSKEEIESTNEELITSNQELYSRIQQVEELYNYYETIIATVHEPVVILDKNIRIKSVNESFCKMFQVTEQETIGESFYRMSDSKWNIAELREQLEDIIPKDKRFHDFEVNQIFPAIGQKTMLLNAHRIFKQSQNEELIVLTIADITQVKQLAIALEVKQNAALEIQLNEQANLLKVYEDSNKRFNMLLMKSPFAFAILKGKEMIVTLANDSIKEIWGKGQDVEGKTFNEVLPELIYTKLPGLLQKVLTTAIPFEGQEFAVKLIRNKKTEHFYFNFVYQPYYEADETIAGVTIIAIDVTAQVLNKKELIQAKRTADQKTKIAENAVQAKQQFLSNMSHEIRTPMNAIIGFTNIILKTSLTEAQKQYLTAIKISGDALLVLINDILDLAKVDSGKMTFEKTTFDLFESLQDLVKLFEIKLKEKNIDLNLQFDQKIPRYIMGDVLRLRQIILNLLSNAVKFTDIGHITLSVTTISNDNANIVLEFSIIDTGIGIPTEKLDAIFNNFEQAHTSSNFNYGGTGLGLAIVKKLIENQGGYIAVKSTLHKGTEFTFRLEFAIENDDSKTLVLEEQFNIENQPKHNFKDVKILVAEDAAINQLLIKIILKSFDFEIDIADNGQIAIDKLQKKNYDLILMDLHMPTKNGFETTEFIRKNLKSNIPIIALTADVTQTDINKCKAIGMNDYVSKPIDEKLLYNKILKILKNRK